MKEADYIAALNEAKENLNNFYREELIKCHVCGKKSQRQKWTLETETQTEAEPGYPVSYRTYFSYRVVCPKCETKANLGSQPPKHEWVFKQKLIETKSLPWGG